MPITQVLEAACEDQPAPALDKWERGIQLYGWDSRTETWSGPTALSAPARPSGRLLQALRTAPGRSWYGPVTCCGRGQPCTRFFTLVHALPDSAVAMIYCHEARTGPAEIVAVVPPDLRARLRPDFAFEFVAFARFLGVLSESGVLAVHDLVENGLADAPPGDALVFSVSSGLWTSDQDYILSECVETIALNMLDWLAELGPIPSVPLV